MTAKVLEIAMTAAVALPEAAQERIGRELLARIESEALRAKVQVGVDQLDGGLEEDLDIEAVLADLRREHAGG